MGHDVSTHSFDKGRFEMRHDGISLGEMTARSTA